MDRLEQTLPLTREGVQAAHVLIKQHVHLTPVLTNTTLSNLASAPQTVEALLGTEWEGRTPARPKIRFWFKCENLQRIGAFKVRGAFHALEQLRQDPATFERLKTSGVVTHSSGNHAQALALAARTFGIPAHIVMPTISTPSKIAATQGYGANVIFSGSTSQEREVVVNDVIARTGAMLIPPYDHPAIILGQGTLCLELQEQVKEMSGHSLNAVIAPCGGGGMLSGVALSCIGTGIRVFGAEPSFQGCDDARRGLLAGERITTVKSLTIADGLRTPLGVHTWNVISDPAKVTAMFAVTEDQIKAAMRLVLERMKVVVEPSAVVGLAAALFNENFRTLIEREGGESGWDLGVVFSGGNTTVEAIGKLFSGQERDVGKVGAQGERVAENVAG
ncbi:tryptophan synthase beta subunit-like PLP-dependent enzyme [Exidia glandulosa HHB12029]|uniref:Tryptophan synthase beta subunit-like PLP-dependent enzyme n=1 Tax=Exidia glandulosa HHB12029 TaxID=1314781 RepID=A0A165QGA1_EXIGL|nr:tryptophan synthase beta subunit-like PLP-dependent enzyme [Exidia glandulosa HHB12029]